MTVFELPTSTTLPYYEFEISLDGELFRLLFKNNSRDGAWYMTVSDVDGNPLRSGLKIVNGLDLLIRWVGANRPAGPILAVPVSDDRMSFPTLGELGDDVVLTYTGER